MLSGGVLLGLGLALASRATSLLEFQLIYGLLVGGATGAVFVPTMTTVTGWFEHRSLAVRWPASAAPVAISPFASWLITNYDWRTAQLVIAIMAWVILVPAAFWCMRPARSTSAERERRRWRRTARRAPDPRQAVGAALAAVLGAVAHLLPLLRHAFRPDLPYRSYAFAGLVMAAVTIYSVEVGGRIVFWPDGAIFGAKRVLVLGLFAQALGAGAYFFVRQLGEFYAVAAVFGLIYGGIMPLYAVIAREYFPMRIMGTVIGASMFSAGGWRGPAVGGWIYDTTGSYGWLYIASFDRLAPWRFAAVPALPSQRRYRQPAWTRREHRSQPRRHVTREALEAGVGVVGPQARRHCPGDDVGESVLADEGSELLHAVLDIAHHPGLRDAIGLGDALDAAVPAGSSRKR